MNAWVYVFMHVCISVCSSSSSSGGSSGSRSSISSSGNKMVVVVVVVVLVTVSSVHSILGPLGWDCSNRAGTSQ